MILSCHNDYVLFERESYKFHTTEFNIYDHNKFGIHFVLHKSEQILHRDLNNYKTIIIQTHLICHGLCTIYDLFLYSYVYLSKYTIRKVDKNNLIDYDLYIKLHINIMLNFMPYSFLNLFKNEIECIE